MAGRGTGGCQRVAGVAAVVAALALAVAGGAGAVATATLTAGTLSIGPGIEGSVPATLTFDFTDDNASATPADFSGVIAWGDGTNTSFSSASVSGGSGSFTVTASHVYPEDLFSPYSAGVEVIGDGGSVAASSAAHVLDAPLSAGTVSVDGGIEAGTPSSLSATFTDANIDASASDFSGIVDWGDGTTTPFTSAQVFGSNGSFTVTGSHAYFEGGNYPVSVTIDDVGVSTTTDRGTATVGDLPLAAGAPVLLLATEGESVGLSAAFGDANVLAPASDFSGTVDWGDGTTTPFSSAAVSGSSGSFTVTGSHVYAVGGNYPVAVTIDDVDGATTTDTGVAEISDPPLFAGTASVVADEGSNTSVLSASFTDANTAAATSAFSGTVDWGDGTTTPFTSADVSGSNGAFTVGSAHAYAEEGSYVVSVTVDDAGGSTVTEIGPAIIADAPLAAGTVDASSGGGGTALGATFTDANVLAPATDFSGSVDWGDGTSTPFTSAVVSGANGSFAIHGLSHAYAVDGSFTVSVTVDDAGGSTTTMSKSIASAALTSGDHVTFGVGEATSFAVSATGTPTPALSETGALPAGVSFTDNHDGTATLAGTPASTAAGTYPFTITASNGVGPDASQSFTLTVDPAASLPHAVSFSPLAAVAGTRVTFTGTGLGGVTEVDFTGSSAPATIVTQTATKLVVEAPPDALVGPLTVHSGVGSVVTSQSFKPVPEITSLSAVDGQAGNEITITGTNLADPLGAKFGSVSASLGLTGTPALTLRATVPAGFSSGKVTVVTPGGTAVSPQVYSVTQVTGFSPASATAGKAITITGRGLGSTTTVDFFGDAGVTPTSVSPTSVRVIVPDDALPGDLVVHTPNTTSESPPTITAKPLKVAPTITSVTPLDGMVGTPVTITGTGFFSDVDTVVKFGTVVLSAYSVVSPTEIDADIPSGFTSGRLTVTTPGGGTAMSKDAVEVTKITSISPAKAAAGKVVTITGLGLGSTTQVDFTGEAANPVPPPTLLPSFPATIVSVSPTAVKVQVPTDAGVGPLTLYTPNVGVSGLQTTADFTPVPALSALLPTQVGGPLSIAGANLEPNGPSDPPTLKLGTEPLLPGLIFPTGILVFSLPDDAVTGTLTVTTSLGVLKETLKVPPKITAGPSPGDALAGAQVTLSGYTFAGTTKVAFANGVSAPFHVTGAPGTVQTLTFDVPATAASGPITVTNAGGSTQSADFTVDPAITRFTPVTAAAGTTITIFGTGLTGADLVTFGGGATAVPTHVTATSLRVVVPSGVSAGSIVVHTPAGDSAPSSASFTPK